MLRGGLQTVGTKSMEEFEESSEMQLLRDPLIQKGWLSGSFGEQVVARHFKSVRLVTEYERGPTHAARRSRRILRGNCQD